MAVPAAAQVQTGPAATSTRFSKGFQRRSADTIRPGADRQAAEAARAVRAESAATARRAAIAAARDRNGNILSHEGGGSGGTAPRGRKFIDHATTAVLERESKRDMLRGNLRFHREASAGAGGHRQALLTQGGHQATKYSSVLGLGRADTVSHGVADNFQYAQYDPAWAATTHGEVPLGATLPSSAPAPAASGSPLASAGSAAVGGRGDAFAANIDAKFRDTFKYGGTSREPNRVFEDSTANARLVPSVPDREAQHKRIMGELGRERAAGKSGRNRPLAASGRRTGGKSSLLAEARLLQATRQRKALDKDIAMVRALK